jgi:hypothetical protein
MYKVSEPLTSIFGFVPISHRLQNTQLVLESMISIHIINVNGAKVDNFTFVPTSCEI